MYYTLYTLYRMNPQKRAIYYTLFMMDPKKTGYLLHFVQDGSSKNAIFITLCTGWIRKKRYIYHTKRRFD